MSNPFIGEIRMFGGNFAPVNWAFCNGQILSISQNDTLFALIGTTYGGDGQQTFALPNLQSRIPIHQGQGPGLSSYVIGQASGTENVTLLNTQMPSHTHNFMGSANPATTQSPVSGTPAVAANVSYSNAFSDVTMAPNMVGTSGGNQPHNNLMPSLAINFIISLYGIFPSRN